jgi:glutaredoxin
MTTRMQLALLAAGLLLSNAVLAQYKYVGPDGKVTYSDVPPPATAKNVTTKKLGDSASAGPALPFEVQQAFSKYPVVLYTGDRCNPCEDARAYLRNRGIPFSEKTVSSDDDIAAFKQQSPDGTAPVILVGSRKSVGFSQGTWAGLLDSAGYPATSSLPRDYQNPAPTPLSPNTKPATQDLTAPAPQAARTRRPVPVPADVPATPTSTPSTTPPGFRF